jgi:hypothetical protein
MNSDFDDVIQNPLQRNGSKSSYHKAMEKTYSSSSAAGIIDTGKPESPAVQKVYNISDYR